MVQTIYRYGNEFDSSVICDKLAGIEEKIAEAEEQEPSAENEEKIRGLMYEQLVHGLRLCTGYRYF